MMHNVETHLPVGWSIAKISEIAEVNPRLEVPAHEASSTVSFVPMTAVEAETGAIDLSRTRHLSDVRKGYRYFRARDVLFAKITPCMENGKMAVVPRLEHGIGFGSTEFHVLRPHREISPDYLYQFVSAAPFRRDAEHHMTGAVGQRRVPTSYLAEQRIPLPPAKEQRRIATKIDELFSALEAGIESLKKARAQLATYRQAVLKHAFEGKLTAQWRKENQDQLETPEQLIARIKQDRAARYHQQIQEWRYPVKQWVDDRRGKRPVRPRKMSLPEPFTDEELVHLPDIPGLWSWSKLGELFSVYVGATPNRKNHRYWNGEVNWISSGEVCFNTIDSTIETISQEGLSSTSADIHPIGTVMLGMIGEGKTRGRVAITNIEACHNQNTAAIRVTETGMQPKFVYYYMLYRYEDTRRIGSGNNQRALNKERVSNLPIPLSSLAEQSVLVEVIEEHLSTIEQNDREIVNSLTKANHLRQAILKRAFSTQLVSQDPNDEPASVLLDRIRTEREQLKKRPRHRETGRPESA